MTESQQPTHHGYAVNVKDHTLYADHSSLSDTEAQQVYDDVAECFWNDAKLIAKDHGFEDCWSAGRMGGWCVPHPQPCTDDMWDVTTSSQASSSSAGPPSTPKTTKEHHV